MLAGFFIDEDEDSKRSTQTQVETQTPKNKSLVETLLEECKDLPSDSKKMTAKEDEGVTEMIPRKKARTSTRNSLMEIVDADATRKAEAEEALKKSVLTPDFENLHAVPRYDVSERRLKLDRQKEREKTKGAKWYGLPATEMDENVKRELEIIRMRSVLDPKRFYKKHDMKETLPKYFQIGKMVGTSLDYYSDKKIKKESKNTLVDSLLSDMEFRKYNKRKFKEIIEEKQKTHYKAWRQAKRLKKKK